MDIAWSRALARSAAVLALAGTLSTGPAAAGTLADGSGLGPDAGALRLDYELYRGGFNAMTFQVRMAVAASAYDIQLQGRTAGLIGAIFPFVLEARTQGVRENGALVPSEYRSASRSGSRDPRLVRIDYEDTGPERVRSRPEPPMDRDELLRATERADFVDPVTGVFAILMTSMDGCTQSIQTFDGRRLYSFAAEDLGADSLHPQSYSVYEGPARVCRLRMKRRAGFDADYDDPGRFPEFIDVWIATVREGSPPVPVRLEADSGLGALRMHLVEVSQVRDGGLAPTQPFARLDDSLEPGVTGSGRTRD